MFRKISLLAVTLAFACLSLVLPNKASAISYNNGTYINLCGTGEAATAHTCNKGCDTNTGRCTAAGSYVVKYTCDGRQANCTSNESGWSSSQSIGTVSCGKTVQLDVFKTQCRNSDGSWKCNDPADLIDYMVWYSGDCSVPRPTATPRPTSTPRPTASPRPTATPTPNPHISTCDSLQVTSGDNQTIPAKVTLRASASDNLGAIQLYRFYFGDGTRVETTEREVTHTYEISGRLSPAVDVKDSQGRWISKSSCQTSLTLKAPAVESFKSGCSEVLITNGNRTKAPTTAEFRVNGYDNKDGLKQYRVDFGNGVIKEGDGQTFEQRYDNPGTYTIKAYVRDSQGNWKGGDEGCRTSLYVETEPITEQPKTGTPTMLGIAAISSGMIGTVALFQRRALLKKRA